MKAMALALAAVLATTGVSAQTGAPDPAAQRTALAKFAMLDGTWTGTATVMGREGRQDLRHTERVGPMLGGAIRVIEGKSYRADGSEAGFNAFAVISYDADAGRYDFRSYAQGHAGTFPIEATGTGFAWTMPAGPATIRYVAVVKDGSWHEEGTLTRPGAPPVQVIVLDLKRTGATDWPSAGAVRP